MIRVHAAVERNTNSAVERINKISKFLKIQIPGITKTDTGLF